MNKLSVLKGIFWVSGLISILVFYMIADNKVQSLIIESNKLSDSLQVLQKSIDSLYTLLDKADSVEIPVALFDTLLISKDKDNYTYKFIPKEKNGNSYFWNFGDGETSNEKVTEHIFYLNKKSEYKVSLDIVKRAKHNQFIETILLSSLKPDSNISSNTFPLPDANFDTILMVKNNSGNTYRFIPKTKNADSYFWNFGDGQRSNIVSPEHTFINSGRSVFTVTFDIKKNGNNNQSSMRIKIPVPEKVVFKLDSTSLCKQDERKYRFRVNHEGGIVTGKGVGKDKSGYYFQPSNKNVNIGKVILDYKYNQTTTSFSVTIRDCSTPVTPEISLAKNQFCLQDSAEYKISVKPEESVVSGNGVINDKNGYSFCPLNLKPGKVTIKCDYKGKTKTIVISIISCPKLKAK